MNLWKRTKPMKIEYTPPENTLSTPDICAIIAACGKAKVRELKFKGLLLRLGPPDEEKPTKVTADLEISEAQQKASVLAYEKLELERKEEELEYLKVENPSLYEELISKGDLDGGNE